jgi:hypothetical protein
LVFYFLPKRPRSGAKRKNGQRGEREKIRKENGDQEREWEGGMNGRKRMKIIEN